MAKFTVLGGTIWVCLDCTFLHANGELPEDPDPSQPGPWARWDGTGQTHDVTMGLMADQHDDYRGHNGDDCECASQDFSWQSCDGCGSTLGGSREAFTWWTTEAHERTLSLAYAGMR